MRRIISDFSYGVGLKYCFSMPIGLIIQKSITFTPPSLYLCPAFELEKTKDGLDFQLYCYIPFFAHLVELNELVLFFGEMQKVG